MAYRVELTDRAENDLFAIYLEINAAESLAATRCFNGFEEAVYAGGVAVTSGIMAAIR